jgi:hypothetical protein
MRSLLPVGVALLLAIPLVSLAQNPAPNQPEAHAVRPGFFLAVFREDPASAGKPKPAVPEPAKPAAPEDLAPEHCAKLELKGIELRPLEIDARIWSDRAVRITRFPEKFAGFQFTQSPAHGLTLKFKVTGDGTVVLGCSSRWGTTAEPEVAKDFTTAQMLIDAGWVRHPRDEIETSSSDMQFLLFTRECKAGEEFTLRTDKYAPPILIFK